MGSTARDFEVAELTRRLANVVRLGIINSVDTTYALATVKIGANITRQLPWLTMAAGEDRTWRAPSVGEQVIVLSQNGEISTGVILVGLYTTAKAAPDNAEGNWTIVFRDGATIKYDTAASALSVTGFETINIDGSGAATINIGGDANVTIGGEASINVTGNTNLTTPTLVLDGDMNCTGTITADEDVVGGGISLSTHKHGGVQTGGGTTGTPI
ncbi:MAG: phage baseplate assembly protein V [Patescibacteria group bacterium]|jgi:phage baseplate assembly protein V